MIECVLHSGRVVIANFELNLPFVIEEIKIADEERHGFFGVGHRLAKSLADLLHCLITNACLPISELSFKFFD